MVEAVSKLQSKNFGNMLAVPERDTFLVFYVVYLILLIHLKILFLSVFLEGRLL